MFCINERYGLLYLLQGGLQLVRRELLLVHPPVVSCVQPDTGNKTLSGTQSLFTCRRPGSIQSIGAKFAGRV